MNISLRQIFLKNYICCQCGVSFSGNTQYFNLVANKKCDSCFWDSIDKSVYSFAPRTWTQSFLSSKMVSSWFKTFYYRYGIIEGVDQSDDGMHHRVELIFSKLHFGHSWINIPVFPADTLSIELVIRGDGWRVHFVPSLKKSEKCQNFLDWSKEGF